ncbi:hypothetical protein GVX82_02360 [Patescibacteria group bacterium]|nr:hypothetical protein [Patescibacteria group bacterium]
MNKHALIGTDEDGDYAGSDYLNGGAGNDQLYGKTGDDIYVYTLNGVTTIF